MKKMFLLLILFLTFYLACGGADQKTGGHDNSQKLSVKKTDTDRYGLVWKEILSEKGRFKIMMPGNPLHKLDTVRIPSGTVEYPSYTTDTLGFYFLAGYSDLPEMLINKAAPAYVLEGSCKGALKEVHGTLLRDTLVQVGDYWYREYLAQLPDSTRLMRIRAFKAGNRVYMMMASAPATDTTGMLGRFIESFSVFQPGAE